MAPGERGWRPAKELKITLPEVISQGRFMLGKSLESGSPAGAIAIIIQLIVFLFIALMEFVGLGSAQRMLLEWWSSFYEPAFFIFRKIVPAEWQFTGNIILGFIGIGFAIVVYAILASFLFVVVRYFSLRKSGKVKVRSRNCVPERRVQ